MYAVWSDEAGRCGTLENGMTTSEDCAALEALADQIEVDRFYGSDERDLLRRAADKLRRIEEVIRKEPSMKLGALGEIEAILK
jgi:hypothetical protein